MDGHKCFSSGFKQAHKREREKNVIPVPYNLQIKSNQCMTHVHNQRGKRFFSPEISSFVSLSRAKNSVRIQMAIGTVFSFAFSKFFSCQFEISRGGYFRRDPYRKRCATLRQLLCNLLKFAFKLCDTVV